MVLVMLGQDYIMANTLTFTTLILRMTLGRGVAGGDGELGCLCGKAGTSRLCDGSAHSSGCVVNGSNVIIIITYH